MDEDDEERADGSSDGGSEWGDSEEESDGFETGEDPFGWSCTALLEAAALQPVVPPRPAEGEEEGVSRGGLRGLALPRRVHSATSPFFLAMCA